MNFAGLAALLLPAPATAQSHLIPYSVHPRLESYELLLRQVLREAFQPNIQASALIVPSFSPEEAIALRRQGDGFEILTLKPQKQLWRYAVAELMGSDDFRVLVGSKSKEQTSREALAGLPSDPTKMPLTRCTRTLDSTTGESVIRAWRHMLDRVQPEDTDTIMLDGTSFFFELASAEGRKTGMSGVWVENSPVEKLIDLSHKVSDHCDNPSAAKIRAISALAREIDRAP